MATKERAKKGSTDRYKIGIEKGSLEVELLRTGKQARAAFRFDMVDYQADPQSPNRNINAHVTFDVCGLWIHPLNNEPIKMHLVPPRNNIIWNTACEVHGRGGEIAYGKDHYLRIDQSGEIVRYGNKTKLTVQDSDTRIDQDFFASKAAAIRAILAYVAQFSPVGGTEMVNFNLVSDDALLDIGFSRVPDMMNKCVAMWYGNPEKSFSLGDGGYEDRHARDQNIVSFLKTMQQEVANATG
jgi:hypothetical protein